MSGWSLMTIRWAWSRRRTSWSCREAETGTSPTCWSMGRGVSKSWKKSRNNNTHTHTCSLPPSPSTVCVRCAINPGVFQTPPHVTSAWSLQELPPTPRQLQCVFAFWFWIFFFFPFFKVVVSPSCPSHNLQIVAVILGWLMEEMRFRKVNIS